MNPTGDSTDLFNELCYKNGKRMVAWGGFKNNFLTILGGTEEASIVPTYRKRKRQRCSLHLQFP
jgi:hypothetical protein